MTHHIRRLERAVGTDASGFRRCRLCADGTKDRAFRFQMDGEDEYDHRVNLINQKRVEMGLTYPYQCG